MGEESASLSRPPRSQKRSPGRRHPEAKEELREYETCHSKGKGGDSCAWICHLDQKLTEMRHRQEARVDPGRQHESFSLVCSAVPGGQLTETQSQEVGVPHPTHNLLWGQSRGHFLFIIVLFICVRAFMSLANAHLCRVLRGDSLDLPIQASLFWQKPLEWKGQRCHRQEHGAAMNSW